ncbi:hypothetical protein MJD09_05745 [bacterium]|nr:hypothetical protein [bacterium]
MRIRSFVLMLIVLFGCKDEKEEWLLHLSELGFWERLKEIKATSELPVSGQKRRVSSLLHLLKHDDQTVRLTTAREIAEIRGVAREAIPHLMANFTYENGEEGLGYVYAVASFGDHALPYLETALKNDDWLIRTRACDAIREIAPKLYLDGECKQKMP